MTVCELNFTCVQNLIDKKNSNNSSSLELSHSSNNIHNEILSKVDLELLSRYRDNRSIPWNWIYIISMLYSVIFILGFMTNSIVASVVYHKLKKNIQSQNAPRYVFIIALAFADTLLCISLPFTAFDSFTKYWTLRQGVFSTLTCKLIKTVPTLTVFLSSFIVIAIALDRYRCIVQINKRKLNFKEANIILFFILIISILVASPLFIHTKVIVFYDTNVSSLSFCIEDWSSSSWDVIDVNASDPQSRVWFSLICFVLQYVLPNLVIGISYYKMNRHINVTPFQQKPSHVTKRKHVSQMLFLMSITYCMGWFPINTCNLILDSYSSLFDLMSSDNQLLIFILCHVVGVSTSVTNPLIYGYMNDNFRTEFTSFYKFVCFSCLSKPSDSAETVV